MGMTAEEKREFDREVEAARRMNGEYKSEDFDLLSAILQGEIPEGFHILHPPALTPEQADAALYLFQSLGVLPERFEKCDCCGYFFDHESSGVYVETTGHNYCEGCYSTETFQCVRCEATEESSIQGGIGKLLICMNETSDLSTGIYRVIRHPFYTDWITGGCIHRDSVEKLTSELLGIEDNQSYPVGFLCRDCEAIVTRQLLHEQWFQPFWARRARYGL